MGHLSVGENILAQIELLNKRRQKVIQLFDKKITAILDGNDLYNSIVKRRRFLGDSLTTINTKKAMVCIKHLLSIPFIYGMIIPSVIWHIGLEIYHNICFRLYGIPLVDFREYFVYDRQLLSWLNPFEKINCIYCSYVNNLIRYSSEIGGRTERYWCPIKYYRKIHNAHSQYDSFIGNVSPKELRKHWEELKDFSDIKDS